MEIIRRSCRHSKHCSLTAISIKSRETITIGEDRGCLRCLHAKLSSRTSTYNATIAIESRQCVLFLGLRFVRTSARHAGMVLHQGEDDLDPNRIKFLIFTM